MTHWPHQSMVQAFYGDPDPDHDGMPNRWWEDESLTRITPPYRMVLAWNIYKPVRVITIHKKCAESLSRILQGIALHFGSEQSIEANRMHLYGGAYNFRLMRGSAKLSMHSYGCAIDLDPEKNTLGRYYREENGMMPRAVVKIFEDEGWSWGGEWPRPDAMHFQAATL